MNLRERPHPVLASCAPSRPLAGARTAFTLIELLVVIAIIAILAAILFPVFAQAREKARAITCLSNMKQMGLGLMQYYQDYDEQGPITRDYNNTSQINWDRAIQPYMGVAVAKSDQYGNSKSDPTLFQCPDNPNRDCGGVSCRAYSIAGDDPAVTDINKERFGIRCGDPNWPKAGSNYCAGENGAQISDAAVKGQPLAAIPAPASLIAIAEHPGKWNQLGSGNSSYVNSPMKDAGAWSYAQNDNGEGFMGAGDASDIKIKPLHSNGWNYVFMDGHAKFYRPEATIGAEHGGTLGNPYGLWTIDPND